MSLITDFRKRGSEEEVAQKMEKTYSARRQEVVKGKPLVAVLKERWPALFTESQVSFHLFFIERIHGNVKKSMTCTYMYVIHVHMYVIGMYMYMCVTV